MSRGHDSPDDSVEPLLIVAHPDDETLWFEPVLSDAGKVLVAFPDHPRDPELTAARRRIQASFPVGQMEFLPLSSVDVIGQSDWRRRRPTEYGVELASECPSPLREAYLANYGRLTELLEPYLAEHPTVFTHNPWGEYGHEEHIQLCHAVLDVGARVGATVWAWDGLSPAALRSTSMRLRDDYYRGQIAGLPRQSLRVDLARYDRLQGLYLDEQAWTWYPTYRPPQVVDYIALMQEGRLLLRPAQLHRVRRDVGIMSRHLRRAPVALARLLRERRLRA